MFKTELIAKSPLRILEKSVQGGLGVGNLGVIAASKGTGKTACLVHIATDKLLQDKRVIHVSFSDDVTHIIDWYENIFSEVAARNNLSGAVEIHDSLVSNRVIMYVRQNDFHIVEIEKRLQNIILDGNFKAETIIIDGYDFAKSTPDELSEIRRFAKNLGLEIWFSASLIEPVKQEIPALLEPVLSQISILITLEQKANHVRLDLIKDHFSASAIDMHLLLDTKILLICAE